MALLQVPALRLVQGELLLADLLLGWEEELPLVPAWGQQGSPLAPPVVIVAEDMVAYRALMPVPQGYLLCLISRCAGVSVPGPV